MNSYYTFASTYGSGSYNASTYENGTTTSTAVAPTITPSGGVLVNTGLQITIAVTLACLLIFAALLIRFWRQPVKTRGQLVAAQQDLAVARVENDR